MASLDAQPEDFEVAMEGADANATMKRKAEAAPGSSSATHPIERANKRTNVGRAPKTFSLRLIEADTNQTVVQTKYLRQRETHDTTVWCFELPLTRTELDAAYAEYHGAPHGTDKRIVRKYKLRFNGTLFNLKLIMGCTCHHDHHQTCGGWLACSHAVCRVLGVANESSSDEDEEDATTRPATALKYGIYITFIKKNYDDHKFVGDPQYTTWIETLADTYWLRNKQIPAEGLTLYAAFSVNATHGANQSPELLWDELSEGKQGDLGITTSTGVVRMPSAIMRALFPFVKKMHTTKMCKDDEKQTLELEASFADRRVVLDLINLALTGEVPDMSNYSTEQFTAVVRLAHHWCFDESLAAAAAAASIDGAGMHAPVWRQLEEAIVTTLCGAEQGEWTNAELGAQLDSLRALATRYGCKILAEYVKERDKALRQQLNLTQFLKMRTE
jgi:hypothetical protein